LITIWAVENNPFDDDSRAITSCEERMKRMYKEITPDKRPLEYNKWVAMFKKNLQSNVVMKKWSGRNAMPQCAPVKITTEAGDDSDDDRSPATVSELPPRHLDLEDTTDSSVDSKPEDSPPPLVDDDDDESDSEQNNPILASTQEQAALARSSLKNDNRDDEESSYSDDMGEEELTFSESEEEKPNKTNRRKAPLTDAKKKRQKIKQEEDEEAAELRKQHEAATLAKGKGKKPRKNK